MKDREVKFEAALANWVGAAKLTATARERYRVAWAKSYVGSMEKTDTSKKATADMATSDLRVERDVNQIELDAKYHRLIFVRGPEVVGRPEEE